MSITDELREWMKGSTLSSWTAEHLTAIADRIDAEHQKALDEWKVEHGQMWLKGYSECHAELLEGNETLASDLERCGWTHLPKDADGEYIHLGDKMECFTPQHPDVPKVFEVQRILMDDVTGWRLVAYPATYAPEECRHHHAPTVEDVLREFANEVYADADNEIRDRDFLCAKYAKRLTLAEGEDA